MFIRAFWVENNRLTKPVDSISDVVTRLNLYTIASLASYKLEKSHLPAHGTGTLIATSEPDRASPQSWHYVPHAIEDVEKAIAICHARNAREAAGGMFPLPGSNIEEPVRSWGLDLTDPKQITMIEHAAVPNGADQIKCGNTRIAIKRAASPPSP